MLYQIKQSTMNENGSTLVDFYPVLFTDENEAVRAFKFRDAVCDYFSVTDIGYHSDYSVVELQDDLSYTGKERPLFAERPSPDDETIARRM